MITIVAKFDVKSQSLDEFTKAAIDVTRETRKERGNLSYKICHQRGDKTKFTFIEEWLNDVSIEQHNNSKHFKEFVNIITPLLNKDIEIEQLEKVPSIFY